MRIAVTGATSFIGRRLIERLTEKGYHCVAVIRRGANHQILSNYACDFVELNMNEYFMMKSSTGEVDMLINLAWLGTRGSDRMNHEIQELSYQYTMDAIQSYKSSSCKIIMTAGSQAEYGNIDSVISEKTSPQPNTEYGYYKLKLFDDASVFCRKNGIRFIEPRFFSLYGPGDYEQTMIVSIMKRMLQDEECDLTESVQMWDFLYIDDAIEGIMNLLENEYATGIFNFASGDCRQLRSYIEEMKTVLQSKSKLNYGAVPYPTTGMVSIMADVTKLESTGWRARMPFSAGIERVRKALLKR